MNKVKTCVYAISLNEIQHVEKFMAANQGADLVLVCDTGSTDGTAERLRELGAIVYNITQKPWRFDIPRNTALSLVPSDIDICLSIDLDEYLQPGWVEAIDDVWQKHNGEIKRISYDYIWNWKEDGITPDLRFFADKIHHRHNFKWKHPCHETLYWEGTDDCLHITAPGVILHHRADPHKSRGQYLHLLKMAVEEDTTNDRMSHYYGRELMFRADYDQAIKELTRHLELPTAQWKEERAASLRFISRCQRYLGKLIESQDTAIKATLECGHVRETWLELARSAYTTQDWHTCYWASTKCLSIEQKNTSSMNDAACWGYEPYDLAALSAYFLGIYEKATDYGAIAVNLAPNDQRLKDNLIFYTKR
jgi:tetratricopeptide (TPR) repeat protein